MKHFFKQTLATIMVLLILLTSVPFAAFSIGDSENGEVNFDATSSIGSVLSETLKEANSQQGENIGNFGFNGVTVEDNVVNVEMYIDYNCTIFMAVYNEDTGLMTYTDKLVAASDTKQVAFDISEVVLPEYYCIKVYMLGENNEPLCTQYEYLYGTRKYQEFFAKTTDDFDEDYVIELGEDNTNNFLVVNSDAVKIDARDSNILINFNEESGFYTFDKIDDKIKNLKQDDVLYYSSDNIDEVVVLKVSNVKIDGDTAIVKQKKTEISDVFEYVKIDNETFADASSYQKAKLGEGVTLIDNGATFSRRGIDIDSGNSFSQSISWKFSDPYKVYSISGIGKISIGINAHVYYDVELFGKDYVDVDLTLSIKFSKTLTLSGKLDATDFFELSIFKDLPITILPGVNALVGVAPIIEFSASITAELSLTYTMGFSYVTDVRCIKQDDCNLEPNFEVDGNLEFKFGLKVTVGVELVESIKLKFYGQGGYIFTGKVELYSANKDKEIVHRCTACLVGEGKKFSTIGVVIEAGWDEINFSCEIVNRKWDFKIGFGKPFYRSLTHGKYFGWGECPNVEYKITVIVKDEDDNLVEGAKILNFYTVTDSDGIAIIYCKTGSSILYIEKEGQNRLTEVIEVQDSPKTFTIVYSDYKQETDDIPDDEKEPSNHPLNEDTTDKYFSETYLTRYNNNITYAHPFYEGVCGPTMYWKINQKQDMVIYGTGDMYDTELPSGGSWNDTEYPSWISHCGWGMDLKIEEGVESLGTYMGYLSAFCDVEKISIPSTVVDLGYKENSYPHYTALWWFESLVYIDVDVNNKCFSNDNVGVLYNKDKTVLLSYPHGNIREIYYTVPSTKRIESGAFAYGNGEPVDTVVLNDGLKEIEKYALNNINNVYIPDSVTYISDSAFERNATIYYEGSKEQWDSVYSDNGISLEDRGVEIFYNSCYNTNVSTFNLKRLSQKSNIETCSNAIVGDSYIMFVVKNKTDDWLNEDNLLYIDQKTAVSTELTFDFALENPYDSYEVIFVGNKNNNGHEHQYNHEWTTIKEDSCSEKGLLKNTCSVCGDEKYKDIPMSEHDFGEWTIIIPAACEMVGLKERKCSNCDAKTTEEIPKLDHDYANEYTVDISPTCIKDGSKSKHCSRCESTTDVQSIVALGHNSTRVINAVEASCNKQGYTGDVYCNDCKSVLTKGSVIEVLEHKYLPIVTNSSCTEIGYITYSCSCGDTYISDYLPAKGHLDNNGDSICDNCGIKLESSDKGCSCNCHKTGLIGVIWKILRFFYKLFKINSVCSCGVAHY